MAKQKQASGTSLSFMGAVTAPCKPEDAFFHILPIPFVGTHHSASDMASAPEAIIAASQQLETWDSRSTPAQHGIYTHPAIDCKGNAEKVLEKVAAQVSAIVEAGKFPIGLGGDGIISFGMVKGLLDAGIEDFGVIHIDAQADLREDVDGDAFAESCVMKRVVDEDVPLFQLGVRSLSKDEADARKVYGVKFYDADFLVTRNITKLELPGEFPERAILCFDIDGLDHSVFPSPGSVPGGLGWWQLLSIIESISQQVDIIGMDLTEYSPLNGQPYYDKAAAQLLYKVMGMVERARL